jgi:hypothetical protein
MFMEVAKPLTLIVCILSLYSVFYTAFLDPVSDFDQRIWESLGLLAFAAGISLVSAWIFCEAEQAGRGIRSRLTATLPLQMFCWASGVMLVLFVVSWYLERYSVFYRDVRIF